MKCIACGAEIEFSPKEKKLKCSYCGSQFEVKDYLKKNKVAKEIEEIKEDAKGPQIETKSYTCTQCGAKLLTFDDTAITFCSYCDSSNVIESELYKGEAPEYVIPFKITKDECEKIYKREIRKHIFAPKEMRDEVVIKKFRGIYMPYGVYKATHNGIANNYGEKYSHRSGDYIYYDKYTISCVVDAEYDGMAFDLSSSFYDKFSQAVGPFDFREAEEFNINYLSGYYADSRDVKKDLYESDAKSVIKPDTTRELLKYKEFRKYGCTNPTLSYEIRDKKIAYYPVYFLAVRNKRNDAVNYAVINGQTGKIAVELPIEFKKYLIFTLLLAIPIFIFLNIFLTLNPKFMLFISLMLSLTNMFIVHNQNSKLKDYEQHKDDKGYKYVHGLIQDKNENKANKIKLGFKNNKTLMKNLIIFFICVATFVLNPVNDLYFYLSAIISFILILFSFKEIIDQYNLLTSRKLSQIGIRGGDESEI